MKIEYDKESGALYFRMHEGKLEVPERLTGAKGVYDSNLS